MKQDTEHSLIKSVTLHLLPGVLAGICYFLIAPFVTGKGFPSVMALILSGIFVLIPFELGFLLYQGRKTGENLLGGVILYWKKIPVWQYFVFVPLVILLSGLLMTALRFTSESLMDLFKWIPADWMLNMGTDWSRSDLVLTYALFLLFIVIILPALEEFYFRGYLLPRMPSSLKGFSGIFHSVLFALYHTWTPWMFISRTIGVFPLIYVVKRKQNLLIGIIAHCLLNSIDFITAVIFLFQ